MSATLLKYFRSDFRSDRSGVAVNPESSAFESYLARHGEIIDWPWLLERAAAHKVAALVAARVEESGLTAHLDPAVQRQLQYARQSARRNAQQALYTLREISPLFDRAGVPFAVLKGVVLAEHVYQSLDLRSFVDTDLVVPPDAVAPAEAALRSLLAAPTTPVLTWRHERGVYVIDAATVTLDLRHVPADVALERSSGYAALDLTAEAAHSVARIAHQISEVTNVAPDTHQPYVGLSAFAHKAGLHASAVKVDPTSQSGQAAAQAIKSL